MTEAQGSLLASAAVLSLSNCLVGRLSAYLSGAAIGEILAATLVVWFEVPSPRRDVT